MAYLPTPAIAEDAASASGDIISPVGFVRRDTPSSDVSAAGDWASGQVNAEGSLRVEPVKKKVFITCDIANQSTSVAYTAGDVIGTSAVTISGVAQASGRLAVITDATFIDNSDVLGALDVYLYTAAYTAQTDNVVPSISDTDQLTFVNIIRFPGFDDLGGSRVAQASRLPIEVRTNGSTSLFAMFVTRTSNAVFTASTVSRLQLWVEQL